MPRLFAAEAAAGMIAAIANAAANAGTAIRLRRLALPTQLIRRPLLGPGSGEQHIYGDRSGLACDLARVDGIPAHLVERVANRRDRRLAQDAGHMEQVVGAPRAGPLRVGMIRTAGVEV